MTPHGTRFAARRGSPTMSSLFSWLFGDDGKTNITVAVGYCTPIRHQVLTAMKPYGVVVHDLKAWGEHSERGKVSDDDLLAETHIAKITVNTQAAEWVEYLLLRTKRYALVSKPINPQNAVWAAKWQTMPRGWRQAGCDAPRQRPQQQAQRRAGRSVLGRAGRIFKDPLDW